MAEGGGERTLIKIAIFCIAMSMLSTVMVSMYASGTSDYDYDTINYYRSQLNEFSGGQLVNDNPWVLKGVYTPFTPGTIPDSDIPNHIEDDNGQSIGWLYGDQITDYPYLDEVVRIKLDPNQKSNQMLYIGAPVSYTYASGMEWWAGDNEFGIDLRDMGREFIKFLGGEPGDDYGVIYSTGAVNNWSYSGLRYVFDPVLPFNSEGSTKDGRLSIVWYDIPAAGPNNAADTGLSGALEIYASNKQNEQVKLGSISATDIVAAYRTTMGYTQVFDFNFDGTHLNLTIQFDPTVYDSYNTLQQAWDAGAWSMSVSTASAGNFFDVENSMAFYNSAGSMLDTFIDIYTFDYYHFDESPWAGFVIWMIVGLPMTLALLFITIRLVGGVFKIF